MGASGSRERLDRMTGGRSPAPALLSPGFLLRRGQRMHTSLWNDQFGAEVTGPQYATLLAIALWPGSDQQTVGEFSGHDKATITGIVERLVSRGLVARESDAQNRRRVILSLTDEGAGRMPAFAEGGMKVHDALMSHLPGGTEDEFVGLLSDVVRARRSLPPQPPQDAPKPGFPVMNLHTAAGHLMRRTHQIHVELWNEVFERMLTIPQYCVLAAGVALEDPDQQSISERAGLNPSSTAAVITRFEQDGWLTRVSDPLDGRRRTIRFTPAARVAAHWSKAGADGVQRELFGVLGPERNARLKDLLCELVSQKEGEIAA